jgi:hypothetical protein
MLLLLCRVTIAPLHEVSNRKGDTPFSIKTLSTTTLGTTLGLFCHKPHVVIMLMLLAECSYIFHRWFHLFELGRKVLMGNINLFMQK